MKKLVIGLFFLTTALGAFAIPPADPFGKPLDSPDCIKVPEDKGSQEGDEVLCVGRNGEFCAYPIRMMSYHRIVNDHLGGPPILVVYDPTMATGQVWDPVVAGKGYNFDPHINSHGYPTIKDRETGSIWSELTGQAVDGPLKGTRLKPITSWIMTWRAWADLHGDSYVLKAVATNEEYKQRITDEKAFHFNGPTPAAINKLAPNFVLGIEADGLSHAYTYTSLNQGTGVLNDHQLNTDIAIFSDASRRAAAAFIATLDAKKLTFTTQDRSGKRVWLDTQTHSVWNLEGNATEGELKGKSLTPTHFVRTRWMAWSAAYPQSKLATRVKKK